MAAGYYEAIVQVRGGKNLTIEKLAETKSMLQIFAAKSRRRDRAAYIAKIKDKSEGLDFYVSETGLARGMAKMLKSKFGAKLKETSKLIGRIKPEGDHDARTSAVKVTIKSDEVRKDKEVQADRLDNG